MDYVIKCSIANKINKSLLNYDKEELQDAINLLINQSDITKKEIAAMFGITRQALVQRQHKKEFSLEMILTICKVNNIELSALVKS